MKRQTKPDKTAFKEPETLASPDDSEGEDDDLWFLPDPDEALEDHEIPLPRARADSLLQAADWVTAQGVHAADLARAALAVGQLDMVVAQIGRGALERLALREVEALSWASGTPIPIDEIARDQLRARASTDPHALQRARWALRRLMGDGDLRDLRTFLGLHRTERRDLPDTLRARPAGDMFDEAAQEFRHHVAQMADAHAFTRAAFARHVWLLSDLSPEEDQLESAVWAARLMAEGCHALPFVPMGQGGRRPSTGVGGLRASFAATEAGATSARVDLQRLMVWRDRALKDTAQIKGNNPSRIIAALVAKPMATTEMVERASDISRDTAERLLARLADMDLVREITGTRRFRIWTAKL